MSRFMLASGRVTTWCEGLNKAILQRKGQLVSRLVSLDDVFLWIGEKDIQNITLPAFEAYTTAFKFDGGSLKALMVALFKILQEKCRPSPNISLIVSYAIQAVNAWIDMYRSPEAKPFNWMIPGLTTMLSFLDKSGTEADNQQDIIDDADDGGVGEERFGSGALRQTENQQKVLNAIRQHIGKFRGDEARQAGYIVLMCESIQMCMALGNIQMASAFLKTVESSYINVSRIPRGPLVSFKYFLGKLYMQQEKFQKAEDALTWSFVNCQDLKKDLKRKILECLTAIRLRMGKIPPTTLLKQFGLSHYLEIVKAMKSGNIRLFESVLADHTSIFIEEGTLLCVEKLKFIVYRTLFKRILDWATIHLFEGKPANVIPIALFTAGFGWQMEEEEISFDEEEMACITANLIKLGYLKGYIAWEHGKIVLSKQTPLPRLQSVQIS